MDASFYTAARGAMTQQQRLNVISNNLANTNTIGYKSKSAVFMDLMYYNMHAGADDPTTIKNGTGVRVQHVNTNFTSNGMTAAAEGSYGYAIAGDGFFMLRNQADNTVTYTRAGNFALSVRQDGTYLVNDAQKLVLDANQNPIQLVNGVLTGRPAVFDFANTNGMESIGGTEFRPVAKNGDPVLVENAEVIDGYVEPSNVDVAQEMADTIIASRAYSYALKMVQTADEVEQTINGLR